MKKTYEQFKQDLVEAVKKKAGELAEVTIVAVQKVNCTEEQITVRAIGKEIAPSMDVKKLYDAYMNGHTVRKIAQWLVDNASEVPDFNLSDFTEDNARKDVFACLISREGNEGLLEKIISRPFNNTDLVAVARWRCGQGSFLVTKALAGRMEIAEDELLDIATENTVKSSWELKTLESIIGNIQEMEDIELPEDTPEATFQILALTDLGYGASVLLNGECLKELHSGFGQNFFILPSSQYEVLVFPDTGEMDAEYLGETVREVNRTEVSPSDKLSDHIYYFDGTDFTMVR